MDFYEKNLSCLKKYRGNLYELLKEADLSQMNNRVEYVDSMLTKDGNKALVAQKNSIVYRLNSSYAPEKEAFYWADQFSYHSIENMVSIFGMGNGIFVREIVNRIGTEGILFIYEPSCEIFLHVMHNYDITDLLSHKKVILAIEDINSFDFHYLLMNSININNIRCQILCVHPKYDALFEESCVWYWKELKDILKHVQINVNTVMAFGSRMIENTLSNIRYLTNSNTILELKEIIPEGAPAIIVSAGPSVRNQIDYLKQAKGKAIIIAVDRILDYLLDEGIEPDLIATVDPNKKLEHFSRRTDIATPLLCFMVSNREIFDAHKGRKIICNCSEFLCDIYEKCDIEPPKMYTGSSVATLAFMACITLEIKNIILVGQDLAYDGNLSHAGGMNEGESTNRDVMVEGINGEMIRSRIDWKEFKIWYEDMITLFPNITVIDAKEKGAKIKGALNMPLKEALEKYGEDNNITLNIEDLKTTFSEEVQDDIKEYFEDCIDSLLNIKTRSKNVIKACDALILEIRKNITTKKTEINLQKMNENIEFILKQPVYRLMDQFIISSSAQYLAQLYEMSDDIKENSLKTYEKSKKIFEAILEAVEYIKPRLEKSIELL